tara:strand:- start:608 stop:751 length:144 start_codon:yes stop_codon:yes gene_type:complete
MGSEPIKLFVPLPNGKGALCSVALYLPPSIQKLSSPDPGPKKKCRIK